MDDKDCLNMKSLLIGIQIGVLCLILVSFVQGAGVTSFFWDGADARPLELAPGESKDIYFELQNIGDDQDTAFKVENIQGSQYVTLLDKTSIYTVPGNSKDIHVNVRLTAPQNGSLGEHYKVGFSFVVVPIDQSSGEFRFGSAFDKYFDIVMVNAPSIQAGAVALPHPSYWPWIMGIVVVLFLIYLVMRRRAD